MSNKKLTIQEIWNSQVEATIKANQVKPRNYISASDIGSSFIDRYYKMTGETPTNPYDNRTLRIFDAGRLFEWIVGRSLAMAGVLKDRQLYTEIPENSQHLKILGYCDYVMGGIGNWNEARGRIKKWLEEFKLDENNEILEKYALKLINGFEAEFGNKEIPLTVLEIKSVNSMAFWSHNNRDEANNFLGYDHHKYQLLTYLIGMKIEDGRILYVSKDDLCLQELAVLRNGDIEQKFWEDVKKMTNFYRNKIVPQKEPEIIYDERKRRFDINWKVGRSLFLTKIYNYKDQNEFQEKNKAKINQINLALKHLREIEKEKDEKKKSTLEKKLKAEQEIIIHYELNKLK
jgi:hypothetical protein